MAIRLWVHCNCLKHGKYKPLPKEINSFVKIEDNSCYFSYPETKPDQLPTEEIVDRYEKEWIIFQDWKNNACKHGNNFTLEEITIGQWSLNVLDYALSKLPSGYNDLQALDSFYINLNGEIYETSSDNGLFSPLECKEFISDIKGFNKKVKTSQLSMVCIEDCDNNYEFQKTIEGRLKWLAGYDKFTLKFDENGFIILRDNRDNVYEDDVIFRSKYFSQKETAEINEEGITRWKIIDIESGKEYLTDGEHLEYRNQKKAKQKWIIPDRIKVKIRKATPADFEYLTKPLEAVFSASVRSGNFVFIG